MGLLGKLGAKRREKNEGDSRLKLYASTEPEAAKWPNNLVDPVEAEEEVMLSPEAGMESVIPNFRLPEALEEEGEVLDSPAVEEVESVEEEVVLPPTEALEEETAAEAEMAEVVWDEEVEANEVEEDVEIEEEMSMALLVLPVESEVEPVAAEEELEEDSSVAEMDEPDAALVVEELLEEEVEESSDDGSEFVELDEEVLAYLDAAAESFVEQPAVETRATVPDGWRDVDVSFWSLELLQAMDWKLFEGLCARVFRLSGYRAEMTKVGPDGGIDLVVRASGDDGEGAGIAVQCKRYSQPVWLREVREFCGVAMRAEHEAMIFITASTFNQQVQREFGAGDEGITLVDGVSLLQKIENLGPAISADLLESVVGDVDGWQIPTCSNCDVKMVRQTTRRGRNKLWECVNFSRQGVEKCWLQL